MYAFRDSTGREWVLRIDVSQAKRVKARTSVDLVKLIDDNMALLSALLADPIQFVDVLWVLCEREAKDRAITDEMFGAALGGDSLGAATDAFVEALVDFFPDPSRRERMRRLLAKGKEIATEIVAEKDRELEMLDPKEAARKLMFGESSTNSPAVPESTRPA